MAKEPRAKRGEALIPTDKFTIEGEEVGFLARAIELDEEARDQGAPEVHVKAKLTQLGAENRFDPASAKIEVMDDKTAVISAIPLPALAEAEGAQQNETDGAAEAAAESETGGTALEEAHARGLDRLERVGQEMLAELDIDGLGAGMVNALAELFRHRAKPFDQLIASQQRDVLTLLKTEVAGFVQKAVGLIASKGFDAIPAKLEFYKDTAGAITASIKIAAADDAVILALHKASGKQIMLVAADSDQFLRKPASEPQADDPELAFESSTDLPEGAEGDRDLAGEEDEEEDEPTERAAALRAQARALCEAQPGYGTGEYRGDPLEAVGLMQEADRLDPEGEVTDLNAELGIPAEGEDTAAG